MGEYVFPGIPLVTVWDPDCDCQPWSGPKLISKVIGRQTDLDINCLKMGWKTEIN